MFSSKFLFSVIVAVASIHGSAASCAHGTHLMRRQVNDDGKVEVSKFGYTGLQGPLNWAGLDAANEACRTAKVQSPIVIDDTTQKARSAPVLKIDNVNEAEFENLGTTLETIVTGTTTFEGIDFKLQQFHLHTPSEHRIREEFFPLEMHMVHEAEDGTIAVIAIPFQLTEDGSTTELLTAVIENIDNVREPGSVTKTGALKFEELINAVQTKPLFQYTGSLTTPPCAEGLIFLVLEEPLPINVKTFNTLKSVIKFNARYSQNSLGQDNLLDVAAKLAAKELNCEALLDEDDNKELEDLDNAANNNNENKEENKDENENLNEEERKKLEEERKLEEKKKLEEERDRNPEDKKKLEEERKLQEKKKLEEERKLEEKKKLEEERLGREHGKNVDNGKNREEERKLEEQRLAREHARKQQEERLRLEHERAAERERLRQLELLRLLEHSQSGRPAPTGAKFIKVHQAREEMKMLRKRRPHHPKHGN